MSHSARQRSTIVMESWYGEPQHDVCEDGGSIEFERYGEPNHEQPPEPPEFVPGIEYRPGRAIDGPARAKRTMSVLRIGD